MQRSRLTLLTLAGIVVLYMGVMALSNSQMVAVAGDVIIESSFDTSDGERHTVECKDDLGWNHFMVRLPVTITEGERAQFVNIEAHQSGLYGFVLGVREDNAQVDTRLSNDNTRLSIFATYQLQTFVPFGLFDLPLYSEWRTVTCELDAASLIFGGAS